MAFVFRNQKKIELRKTPIPGPGTYDFNVQKQTKIPKAFVPFGSMQPKLRAVSQYKNDGPGVGTYNIDMKTNGQKIIVSSETEDIKILQISRPNPVFKSGTVRFKGQNQQSPGPGDYDISKAFSRNKIYSVGGPGNKSKVIEHLININKYQSIPSIPSNIHAYGYNDSLELNEPPVEVYKGQKGDSIGPGQYDTKIQTVKPKGIAWSQPKTKRIEKIEQNQNLGPGCYQIKTMQPLYSFKPSPQFASKTLRSMDQRKGHIPNGMQRQNFKQSKITENPGESRIFSQKAPPSTQIGDDSSDDDSVQYADDTTPGPGSYDVASISSMKKFYSNKQKSSFGVSSIRFSKKPQQTGSIGPGQYYQQIKPRTFKCKTIKKSANNQGISGVLGSKNNIVPGPGSYQPRNTMQDKLIYKIQRGYRGQFGSTEARGKEEEFNEEPGPGSYDPKLLQDEKQVNSIFKSSTKRKSVSQAASLLSNPPPGSYNLTHTDIATKVLKQQQQDPDLIIKKPGFGIGQARFKQTNKILQQDYEDDDIIKQIQQKYREQKKRKNLKPSAAFRNKQDRFNGMIKKQIPGPGAYYDGEQDHWNKRTYNILFADI